MSISGSLVSAHCSRCNGLFLCSKLSQQTHHMTSPTSSRRQLPAGTAGTVTPLLRAGVNRAPAVTAKHTQQKVGRLSSEARAVHNNRAFSKCRGRGRQLKCAGEGMCKSLSWSWRAPLHCDKALLLQVSTPAARQRCVPAADREYTCVVWAAATVTDCMAHVNSMSACAAGDFAVPGCLTPC